eukprot:CCRYP_013161-RA/>CCRYP_013161-RA protein AED:0.49 eAED:0.49 QI:0/0/0/1/0/0/2/0/100
MQSCFLLFLSKIQYFHVAPISKERMRIHQLGANFAKPLIKMVSKYDSVADKLDKPVSSASIEFPQSLTAIPCFASSVTSRSFVASIMLKMRAASGADRKE